MIRYNKVKKRPRTFLRLFGVRPEEVDFIVSQVRPLWEERVIGAYKRPGRYFKLDLEEMILMVLLYYRSYATQLFVGVLFGIDESRVCRLIQKLEPLIEEVFRIPRARVLKKEDVEQLIDATEQTIERPKQDQKVYYSGKKKRHTLKTEIRVNLQGKILHVSGAYPGSTHDFKIHKQEPPLKKRVRGYMDSAYQGIEEFHPNAEIPFKKPRGGDLDEEEKHYNEVLSRIRVKVENILAQIKVFRILADRFRNKRCRYSIKFKIIAGIVNLKNGFAPA
jgi:hypothetical protein